MQFKKFADAVDAVSGGIGDVNGYKVELPRGVPVGDFKDFFDDIQPETIADLGGVMGRTDEEAADLVREGRVVTLKDNRYKINVQQDIVGHPVETLWKADGSGPLIIAWSDELKASNEAVHIQKLTKQHSERPRIRAGGFN